MPITGPNCPKCSRRGALTRESTERVYVRRNDANSRRWDPVGWYCKFCGGFQPDAPIITDKRGVRWTSDRLT